MLAVGVPRAAYAARCANYHTSVSEVKHRFVRLAYAGCMLTNVTFTFTSCIISRNVGFQKTMRQ